MYAKRLFCVYTRYFINDIYKLIIFKNKSYCRVVQVFSNFPPHIREQQQVIDITLHVIENKTKTPCN